MAVLGKREARLALVAGLGALAISVPGLGCGSDGGTSGDPPTVETFDFGFGPDTVTVDRGARVRWENTGATTHNVKGRGFFSGALEPGDGFSRTFRRPGTYRYVCTLHPTLMRGEIVVG